MNERYLSLRNTLRHTAETVAVADDDPFVAATPDDPEASYDWDAWIESFDNETVT